MLREGNRGIPPCAVVSWMAMPDAFTVATKYWHALDDGRIQCDVCPRACKLRESQRGVCVVRAREHDQVVLTTYGRSSGFCVDPIEKKPLNHFLPGSSVLSFGSARCSTRSSTWSTKPTCGSSSPRC